MEKIYSQDLKDLCKKEPSCHCPDDWQINDTVANLPEWLRRHIEDLEESLEQAQYELMEADD